MPGRPRTTLTVVVLVTLALLPAALRVRVDSAVDRLLPAGDPARAHLDRMHATFGSEEIVVVALFADDVFVPATLTRVARLTDAIADLDVVRDVASLTNLDDVRVGPDGLGRTRVLPPPPWTPDALSRARADALAHPLARGGVVAPDGRATGIVVQLEPMTDDALLGSDLARRLRVIVDAHPGPEGVAITGLPLLKLHAADAMVRDVVLFFGAGVLVVAAVLLAAFRTIRGVVLPLASVLVGLVWTSAAMTLAGGAYTLGTLVLSPLLLAIGIAYAIHVTSRFESERLRSGSAEAVVARTLDHVRLPTVMAAVTTLAGFAPFLGSPIPTIRDFGWYGGIGIACVLAATLTVLPSALALLPPAAAGDPAAPAGWIERFVVACARAALARRGAVGLCACGIVVVAVLGIGRIAIETDYLRFFPPEHPARLENARVAEALVGTQVVSITLAGPEPGALTRLEAVAGLRELVAFVGAQPGVVYVASLLDHLYMLRRAIEPETSDAPLATQPELDQRVVLLSPERTRRVLAGDHSTAQILVHTSLSGSQEIRTLVRRIEEQAARRMPSGIETRASGTLVLLTQSADVLARQQVSGFGQVAVALGLLLVALFRSLRLGMLSLVPNLFPVVVLFGLMGWLGIDLDVSTSMIACIAIGIAVDDTIHYLTTYGRARRAGRDDVSLVLETTRAVGRPIVLTSVTLSAGFLVPCLSSFQPVRHFGILSSATMAVALFADLLLLPVLLVPRRAAVHRETR